MAVWGEKKKKTPIKKNTGAEQWQITKKMPNKCPTNYGPNNMADPTM